MSYCESQAECAEKDATIAELRQRDKVISRQLERVAGGHDPLTKDLRERLDAADATIARLQEELARARQLHDATCFTDAAALRKQLTDHARLVEQIVHEMQEFVQMHGGSYESVSDFARETIQAWIDRLKGQQPEPPQ